MPDQRDAVLRHVDVELQGGDAEVERGLESGTGLFGVLAAPSPVSLQIEGGREIVDRVRTRDADAGEAAGDLAEGTGGAAGQVGGSGGDSNNEGGRSHRSGEDGDGKMTGERHSQDANDRPLPLSALCT